MSSNDIGAKTGKKSRKSKHKSQARLDTLQNVEHERPQSPGAEDSEEAPSMPSANPTLPRGVVGDSSLASSTGTPEAGRPSPSAHTIPPKATWEEVTQYALNTSILSGTFEDVRIHAFTQRTSSGRVTNARALHANGALLRRALSQAHNFLDGQSESRGWRQGTDNAEGLSLSASAYDYAEDSDLEDCEGEPDSWQEDPREARNTFSARGPPSESDDSDEDLVEADRDPSCQTTDGEGLAGAGGEKTTSGHREVSSTYVSSVADAFRSSIADFLMENKPDPATDVQPNQSSSPSQERVEHVYAEATATPRPPIIHSAGTSTPQRKQRKERRVPAKPRTTCPLLSTDVAFRTWRSIVFYAYTGRVAFAPPRSQGLVFQADDDDPAQLPICSPKSMYRLAFKYGNEELKTQAGNDIQSKLSTQNVLTELFSNFTCRFPDVRDMELNFLLTHIKHPDIVVRLPLWVEKFAVGELRECADTFGTLIHKLSCAMAAPQGFVTTPTECPRGCSMPTIRMQFRCSTCGYVMT